MKRDRYQTQRPESPAPSCLSMKSDWSMHNPPGFSNEPVPPNSDEKIGSALPEVQSRCAVCEEMLSDPVSTTCGHWFCRQCITSYWDQPGPSRDYDCPQCRRRQHVLQPPAQPTVKQHFHNMDSEVWHVSESHRKILKGRFEFVVEGSAEAGTGTPLNRIYTDLYITEGETEGVNDEHEVWQLETVTKTNTFHDTPINCNDIFKPLPGQERHIRTVLTKGIAGIGKTFCVQKFALDWAEKVANQDVLLMFLLSFRELNLIKDEPFSLLTLIHVFYTSSKRITAEMLAVCKVVFIFDGLDESRLPLDFQHNEIVSDVKQTSMVDVLLTNLVKGNLLPSALLWITSRPAAANQIPPECVDLLTEVRGFTEPQKEEFFKKRFSANDAMANRIISHIKTSRSLHIMCHIPVFCWITAIVLMHMLSGDNRGEMPKTLTEMYIHFLLIQTNRKNQKYHERNEVNPQELMETDREVILKLGKLAFKHLEKGSLVFYQRDVEECGLDVKEASLYSGVCTQIFKRESLLFQKTVYCFVHLSVQEFLAAVYMFHCYTTKNMETLDSVLRKMYDKQYVSLEIFLWEAMSRALESKNGHLDLFVRFLHGLSLESNQTLLGGLMARTDDSPDEIPRAIEHLKGISVSGVCPDRYINTFHCLMEMKDHSIQQEIQKFLKSKNRSGRKLSDVECSALAYMLQMSEEVLDEFDPKTYNTSEKGRRRLLPAVRNFKIARLADCKLNKDSYEVLASALSANPSHLRELDLSNNELWASVVTLLSVGLDSPHCRLETLKLSGCLVTEEGCVSLALALTSNPSHLRILDLSYNHPGCSGVTLLSALLKDACCKLEKLKLIGCKLTTAVCEVMMSALSSNTSYLRELDLSSNELQDSGIKMLSAGLDSPHCRLESLRLSDCLVTEDGCASLASAVRSNPSHLRELDMSYNHPGPVGMSLLNALIKDPDCRLETLNVEHPLTLVPAAELRRYACDLTLDPNTAHRLLSLSEENRKVTWGREEQPYPDHPERFDSRPQLLCREGLTGRCYWEVEWSRLVDIAVTYRGINRKGGGNDCRLGQNEKSWSLSSITRTAGGNSRVRYSVWHNNSKTDLPVTPSDSSRVGVYLDWPGGSLSFYRVSSHTLTHLYTFHSTFTEPLYPGFRVGSDTLVFLCQLVPQPPVSGEPV